MQRRSKPAECWTLPLRRLEAVHLPLAGAKAVTLGQMLRAGLPVPPGFVLTVAAFESFLGSAPDWSRIQANVAGTDSLNIEASRKRILEALANLPLPLRVAQAVNSALAQFPDVPLWAVRSSGIAEDSPAASFAGQHESFLNVPSEEILIRVRQCWLSLFSSRALLYRTHKGILPGQARMAVIVQQMVPAETAGVLFTMDPVAGDASRIVIEGARGLGENVVGGRVVPDRIVLAKTSLTVLERTPGAPPDGNRFSKIELGNAKSAPQAHAGLMILDDRLAQRLAELSRRTERALSGPLDIEWASCGEEIYLLQARPVTGRRPAKTWEERQIWTNANAGEAFPDVVTPMTFSLISPFLQGLCDNLLGYLGYHIPVEKLVRLIGGRPYFNANIGVALLRRIPGVGPEDIGKVFGGAQEHLARLGQIQLNPDDLPRLEFSPWRVVRGLPSMVWTVLQFSFFWGDRSVEALARPEDRLPEISPEKYSDHALLQAIHASLALREAGRHPALRCMGIGAFHVVALHALLERWFGREGIAMASRLMTGLGTLHEAEAGRDLWHLAEFASQHAELRKAVEESDAFAALESRLGLSGVGQRFLNRWRAFLAQHGHHTRGEVELMNPRWSETPDSVLAWMRNYLEAIVRQQPIRAIHLNDWNEEREAVERECLRRLKNPLKRGLFRWMLRRAQYGVAIKENVKTELVRRIAQTRRLLLELGHRLVQYGRCADRDDVFFLTVEELRPELLFGVGGDLRPTISSRRTEYQRNKGLNPPPVIFGTGDPEEWQPEAIATGVDQLRGLPVSPGQATGRARVIVEISPHDRVLPGEILVAPSTDPGWSPFFLPAAGIVIDLGGMLSHGSIIAREYGIPAVANVGPATRIIRTGDLVRVDGNRGRVTVLERAKTP